jgi:putative salt-induced outer membrane protein YdiY
MKINIISAFCLLANLSLLAQALPEPDVLVFTDGERLIGHLVGSTGASVTFKSDMAGEITVDWSKVKELHSSAKFAVAEKGIVFGRRDDPAKVPQGTVAVTDQKLQVTPANGAAPQTIPLADTSNIIPQDSFLRAFEKPRLSQYWKGSASFGAAIVAATQNSRSFSSAVSLVRTVPNESWISPRYRTTVDFNAAYGELTEPNPKTTVKTDIIHAGVEQDEFLTQRVFAFGAAAWDHSLSQGLDLQQTYGGGLGFTVFKTPKHELDLKGEMAYVSQKFAPSPDFPEGESKHLVGSVLTETYDRLFTHGMIFHEQVAVTPVFNDASAYSAIAAVNLAIPVYKRLAVTIGSVDSYLNSPPPNFKRNSFQFQTSLAYTIN